MVKLSAGRFSWERHSDLVRQFHEDIVVSSLRPEHMSMETYLQLLRRSEKHGLPAYMRVLREAYDEGKDGMFIWEAQGDVVGWSWLKVHENEFFKEGVFGEISEIYVAPRWRRKGIGKSMMNHAHDWLKERGVSSVRVEAVASNKAAMMFYEEWGYEPHYVSLQVEL